MKKDKLQYCQVQPAGALRFPEKWVKANLNAGPKDLIVELPVHGTDAVVLVRWDPMQTIPDRLLKLSEPEPVVPALVPDEE